jgi:hypothetical protein
VAAGHKTEAERDFLCAHQQSLHGRAVTRRRGSHKSRVLGLGRIGARSTGRSLVGEDCHVSLIVRGLPEKILDALAVVRCRYTVASTAVLFSSTSTPAAVFDTGM